MLIKSYELRLIAFLRFRRKISKNKTANTWKGGRVNYDKSL